MKNKLLYWGVGLGTIVIAFVFSNYLISAKPVPKKDNLQHNTVFVKTEKVELVNNKSDMSYRGRITAFDNVSLAAEVQGKLIQGDVRFKAGQNFNKNDVLIKIYSKDVEAALKSGKSSFLQTLSAILPDLKVDYPNEYQKWNNFFTTLDVEKPLPQLPQITSNKEKVFLAANNVLANYYTLQQQEINLSRYTIRAPFTGSFKSVNKEIGAVSSPGAELATIIRTDRLEITIAVPPAELKWIKKGNKVQIANGNDDFKNATVSRISAYVDETTQSVNVYLSYNNSTNIFLQGEYVDVILKSSSITGFEIPREALLDNDFVYVLNNKKLEKAKIKILQQLDDSYIISGVKPNEIIVTESLASIDTKAEYLAR